MHEHGGEVKEYTLSVPLSSPHWTCVLLYKPIEFTSVPYSLLGVKPTLMTGDYLVLITILLLLDSSAGPH